jgi:hypothetical protein
MDSDAAVRSIRAAFVEQMKPTRAEVESQLLRGYFNALQFRRNQPPAAVPCGLGWGLGPCGTPFSPVSCRLPPGW